MTIRHAFRTSLRACLVAALAAAPCAPALAQTQWSKLRCNPVLSPGPPGSWDQSTALVNTVLKHEGIYKMWYLGDNSFGYATSNDGITWVKSPANPVLQPGPPGSWDEHATGLNGTSVVIVNSTYHMFYSAEDSAHDARIGHATSPDGINWTKDPANPVIDILPNSGPWDTNEAFDPFVIHENDQFRMWYTGVDSLSGQRILYATSPDGTAWSRDTTAFVLEKGPSGSWDEDALGSVCVLHEGGAYQMWYMGWNAAFDCNIGHATSPDGLAWTKDPANPVLANGGPGSWDQLIGMPVVTYIDSLKVMYYGGFNAPTWPAAGAFFRTGMARWPEVSLVPDLGAVQSVTIEWATPNPFNSRTAVHYALAEAGPVRLGVYDAAGRLVRTLVDGQRAAGRHAEAWNGANDCGGAGVYFIRLESAGRVTTRKVVFAK